MMHCFIPPTGLETHPTVTWMCIPVARVATDRGTKHFTWDIYLSYRLTVSYHSHSILIRPISDSLQQTVNSEVNTIRKISSIVHF